MEHHRTQVGHRLGRGMLCGVLATAVLSILLAAPATAQTGAPPSARVDAGRVEAGRVEARLERNYARLVFSFAQRPRHTLNAQAGVLVVRFERPIDVHLEEMRRTLAPLVASVRLDPDRQGVRFALTRRLRVNTAEAADQLYVDLLPEPWSGPPPALPPEVVAEIERRAAEEERERREDLERQRRRASVGPVEAIASETATFSRLELRWRDRVDATVRRSGRDVHFVFDKLGRLDPGPVRARLPRFIENIRVSEEDARTVVTLTIDPVRDIRTFIEGNAFFIDVQGPERGRAIEFRADGSMVSGDIPPPVTAPSLSIPGTPDDRVAERPEPPAPAPSFALQATPETPRTPPPAAPEVARPGPAAPEVRGATPQTAAPQAQVARPTARPPGAPVRIEAAVNGPATELRLLFGAQTPAAVYLRGRTLTMVFDTQETVDPSAVRTEIPRLVRSATRERAGRVEIIRLELEEPMLVAAEADGHLWTVRIGDAPATSVRALEPRSRTLADGRGVIGVDVPGATQAIRVADRVVGDTIIAVTVPGPQASLIKPQRYVDVELLQTAHGLAIRENAEDVSVKLEGPGVTIEREQGLSVSVGAGRAQMFSPLAAQDTRTGFVDFEGWKLGPVDSFGQIRDGLVSRASAIEKPSERTALRLELARFFLSHALGHEAQSLLSMAGRDDPALERDISFRVLRGVANVLAHRPDDAERDLQSADIDDSPDVALWRGIANAQRRDWAKTRRFLQRAELVLPQYPRVLQARAVRSAAEAAIELGDLSLADGTLDEALSLDPSPNSAARVALLRGRLAEMTGRLDTAFDHYTNASRAADPAIAAEATVRRVALGSRLDRIARDAAVGTLEGVSLAWRGDHVELEAYRILAGLNVARGDYRAAFAAAAAAVGADPRSDTTRAIQDEVREAFADLFLSGRADQRPPLEALALFYDFREFVPPGRRGDEMIRNLAERLVEVDLLDQAADLLTHQVDNRLQGAARADVATRLAFIHLMNREPEKALSVLRRTRAQTLPRDLERRRMLIEARALAALGRPELAIELLGTERSDELARMRADILWDGKRWAEAAAAAEGLLGEAWRRATPLGDRARSDVMRAVVGYALAGDQASVDRMRTRFAALMADTPEASSFRVLTGRIETQATEFRAIVRDLAGTDTLSRFLQEYRERYAPSRGATPQATLPNERRA